MVLVVDGAPESLGLQEQDGLGGLFLQAEKGVVDWLVELGHAEFASNGVEIGKVPLERAEQRVNETLSGVGLAELRVARLSLNDAFFELGGPCPGAPCSPYSPLSCPAGRSVAVVTVPHRRSSRHDRGERSAPTYVIYAPVGLEFVIRPPLEAGPCPAVGDPTHRVAFGPGRRACAREASRRVAFQRRMARCRGVVGLEVGELPLQITGIPAQHMIQEFSPHRPDQPFHTGV